MEEAQASKEDDNDGRVSSHPVTTSVISVCFQPDNCRCVRSSSRLEYSTGMALVKVNDDFHVGKFLALTLHPPRSPLLPMRGSENWETEHRISQEPHFTHLLHGTSAPWGDFSFFSFGAGAVGKASRQRGPVDREGCTGQPRRHWVKFELNRQIGVSFALKRESMSWWQQTRPRGHWGRRSRNLGSGEQQVGKLKKVDQGGAR